jgi:hypothetical protein
VEALLALKEAELLDARMSLFELCTENVQDDLVRYKLDSRSRLEEIKLVYLWLSVNFP